MKSFFLIFPTSGSVPAGAIGGQTDKYPIQEVGEEDHPDAYPLTGKNRALELLSYDPPLRNMFSMSPDEIKMGSSKPQSSQLLVYDRGKHPGEMEIFMIYTTIFDSKIKITTKKNAYFVNLLAISSLKNHGLFEFLK